MQMKEKPTHAFVVLSSFFFGQSLNKDGCLGSIMHLSRDGLKLKFRKKEACQVTHLCGTDNSGNPKRQAAAECSEDGPSQVGLNR